MRQTWAAGAINMKAEKKYLQPAIGRIEWTRNGAGQWGKQVLRGLLILSEVVGHVFQVILSFLAAFGCGPRPASSWNPQSFHCLTRGVGWVRHSFIPLLCSLWTTLLRMPGLLLFCCCYPERNHSACVCNPEHWPDLRTQPYISSVEDWWMGMLMKLVLEGGGIHGCNRLFSGFITYSSIIGK